MDNRNLFGEITIDREAPLGPGDYGKTVPGLYRGRAVCIKTLRQPVRSRDVAVSKKTFDRLVRELKVWRDLVHPNVLRFHGWALHIENEEEIFARLISTLCEGGNVRAFLNHRNEHRSRLGRDIICQTVKGLAYLHHNHIIHGDMKPENVVIGSLGVQICDFGLSAILGDSSTWSRGSSMMTTVRFSAPELVEQDNAQRDFRSDMWALGCTCAEILSGKQPYDHIKNLLRVPSAIMDRDPPYQWDNPTSDKFERVIWGCLQHGPEDRPRIDTVVEALHAGPVDDPGRPSGPWLSTALATELWGDRRDISTHVEVVYGKRMGGGDSGTVYWGTYKEESVRVKVLKGTSVVNEKSLAGLLRHFRDHVDTWCDLAHPNVSTFHGWTMSAINEEFICVGLISPWSEYGDVMAYLKTKSDSDSVVRRTLVCGIASGLSYLHSKSVVHGNLKPTNVIVDASGTIQLCDFRLFCIPNYTITTKGFIAFVPSWYTAPELIKGTMDICNLESDVWSFGCTSFEVLYNRRPYAWNKEIKSWFEITELAPYNWNSTDEFESVIGKCLDPTPTNRQKTSEVELSLMSLVSNVLAPNCPC